MFPAFKFYENVLFAWNNTLYFVKECLFCTTYNSYLVCFFEWIEVTFFLINSTSIAIMLLSLFRPFFDQFSFVYSVFLVIFFDCFSIFK